MPNDLLAPVQREEARPVMHSEAPLAVTGDAASLMSVISRAASDPNVDIDKFERLLALSERIKAQEAAQMYHDAMSSAQAEMRPIAADASNPQTKSKYASFVALDRALRPIYTRHGFALSYDTGDGAPPEYVRVICKVSHRGGHSDAPHIDMPADGKGAKGGDVMTKTHATGAAMTYGQRYLLKMVFNIAVGDDDDGNSNGRMLSDADFITPAQRDALNLLIEEVGADKIKFCHWFNISHIGELPAREYKRAERMLKEKARKAPNA